jgi:integrase
VSGGLGVRRRPPLRPDPGAPSSGCSHAVRSGLATAAAAAGAPERAIMRQGGWRSDAMVRRYIRTATLFEENAASYCGL